MIFCRICSNEILLIPSKAKTAKYCSQKCFRMGIKKDIKDGIVKIGGNLNNKSTTGRIGEKANHWKGDEVSYNGLHQWIRKHLGKPNTCKHCGRSNLSGRFIQWANISHKYKRDFSDWIRLCVPCHKKYDGSFS